MGDRVLRTKQVCEIINISPVTLWRYRRDGQFPKPIQLGDRIIGWKESVVMEWLDQKVK